MNDSIFMRKKKMVLKHKHFMCSYNKLKFPGIGERDAIKPKKNFHWYGYFVRKQKCIKNLDLAGFCCQGQPKL